MNSKSTEPAIDSNIKTLTSTGMHYQLFALFVAAGFLYLLGFWQKTGLNIIQFLNISDLVRATIQPLATFLLISLGMGLYSNWLLSDFSPKGPLISIPNSKYKLIAIPTVGLLSFLEIEGKWLFIGLILAFPTSEAIDKIKIWEAINPPALRKIMIVNMTFIILCSYGMGQLNFSKIENGEDFLYLDNPTQQNTNTEIAKKLRLLGNYGSKIFFYDPSSGKTIILAADSAQTLELKYFKGGSNNFSLNETFRSAIDFFKFE